MKLRDNIKQENIEFKAAGVSWYMKPPSVNTVQKLQTEFKKMEENPDDFSPLMMLFTDILVDENGEVFEDVAAGMTFEELSEFVPITTIQEIADEITKILAGQAEGK